MSTPSANNSPMPMDDPLEVLDVVDATDTVIGTQHREDIHKLMSGQYFRGIGCFLINNKGQLCIPRRQAHKKIAPNGLDFSVGEHVGSGESYFDAAIRGLREETGISATPSNLNFVGAVPPFQGLSYFHHIFTYPAESTPQFSADDFSEYMWVTPNELLRRLRAGEPAKEILLPSVELLMQMNGTTQSTSPASQATPCLTKLHATGFTSRNLI